MTHHVLVHYAARSLARLTRDMHPKIAAHELKTAYRQAKDLGLGSLFQRTYFNGKEGRKS